MADIKELFENGDFAAVEAMLNAAKAHAESVAREKKEKEIEAARAEMMASIKKYCAAIGEDISDERLEQATNSFIRMEKLLNDMPRFGVNSFEYPSVRKNIREGNKPIVISTAELDDDVLKRFLDRMGFAEREV